MIRTIILTLITFSLLMVQTVWAGPIQTFVSIVPQKYFVEKIGGEHVKVEVMVRPGASPATYEPKPAQMVELSNSKVYFAIGVPFEETWLEKIAAANSAMKVVHTEQGIEKVPMGGYHHHGATGSDKNHHEGGRLDPHIWLSPPLVMVQLRTILSTLKELDPGHGQVFEANYQTFVSEIKALDQELKSLLEGKSGRRFMVFHPAWGYFAGAYGLEQIPVEIEGKDPKPSQLKELIARARKNDIRVIFVQPQFSAKSARQIAREIEGEVVTADPLAADWLSNLREVAAKFKSALR